VDTTASFALNIHCALSIRQEW